MRLMDAAKQLYRHIQGKKLHQIQRQGKSSQIEDHRPRKDLRASRLAAESKHDQDKQRRKAKHLIVIRNCHGHKQNGQKEERSLQKTQKYFLRLIQRFLI